MRPPMITLTLDLAEALATLLAMLLARREMCGKQDAPSALRVAKLNVAIAQLVERIDAHNAAVATARSADSSAASAVSTDDNSQRPVK